jgi:hypothetical protein
VPHGENIDRRIGAPTVSKAPITAKLVHREHPAKPCKAHPTEGERALGARTAAGDGPQWTARCGCALLCGQTSCFYGTS